MYYIIICVVANYHKIWYYYVWAVRFLFQTLFDVCMMWFIWLSQQIFHSIDKGFDFMFHHLIFWKTHTHIQLMKDSLWHYLSLKCIVQLIFLLSHILYVYVWIVWAIYKHKVFICMVLHLFGICLLIEYWHF